MILPLLRSQSEIKADIAESMNDAANLRYSSAQIYRAMNRALRGWENRVFVPFLHTLTDGFGAGAREYLLPNRVNPQWMVVQWKHPEWIYNVSGDDSERAWETIYGWDVYPTGDGTATLRLDIDPPDTEARIIYYAAPGSVPLTLPVLNAGISDTATSLALTTIPVVGRNGFIKINGEELTYQGNSTLNPGLLQLSSLVRATNNTAAATHAISSTVEWLIPAHDPGLYEQLMFQSMAHLVDLNLVNPASDGRARHSDNWNRWQTMAENYWKRHVPIWQPSKKIRVAAAGAPLEGTWMQGWWGRS